MFVVAMGNKEEDSLDVDLEILMTALKTKQRLYTNGTLCQDV